jgi:hypothetical protein
MFWSCRFIKLLILVIIVESTSLLLKSPLSVSRNSHPLQNAWDSETSNTDAIKKSLKTSEVVSLESIRSTLIRQGNVITECFPRRIM